MTTSVLARRANAFRIREHLSPTPDIYSVAEFRAILKHEYACANRNQHEFSLVVFDFDKPVADYLSSTRLIFLFHSRLRRTDNVGWLDKRRIGILLPFTSAVGARRVADEIRKADFIAEAVFKHYVYTYPSAKPGTADGPEQLQFSDINPEWGDSILYPAFSGSNNGNGAGMRDTTTPSFEVTSVPEANPVARFVGLLTCAVPLWKRVMDIVASLTALILISPLFLLVAILIKTVSRGPVFFCQERVGYLGKTFRLLKFRTMKVDADASEHKKLVKQLIKGGPGSDADKPMTKLKSDPRIIPFGNFLRKTCIDELPQLINVLTGRMSLVGPRPCLPYEASEYHLWHTERFNTLPGMTGLWQVSGKNRLTFKEMVRYDITYARERSILLDIKILLKTIPTIFTEIKGSGPKKKQRNSFILKESMTNA